jgi:rhodanese-related sulfurtransferase
MPITKTAAQLVADASAQIKNLNADIVKARMGTDPTLALVDIRDVRELERSGVIESAHHAPRGMLEFWVDPASPYFKPFFADESKQYVLFCGGGWRSALAAKALQDMGMTNVAHIEGGFDAMKAAGFAITTKPPK